MDIVYSLRNNYDGEELTYSLRSLVNIPHDNVFFVGGCPSWAQNIVHIPTEQTGTKWRNVPKNLITVCQDKRISEDFIYFNDDFFVLLPVKNPMRELNLYNSTVQSVLDKLNKKHSFPTPYMGGMKQTQDLLKELGKKEPLSYELHIPFVFNKDNFLKMFDIDGVKDIEVLHYRSLYGNLYLTGGQDMRDVKVFNHTQTDKQNGRFLSCSNAGFGVIKPFLKSKFPTRCNYEQDRNEN